MKTPRGIRNNNPLNIRRSASPWVGKIQPGTDALFEQFDCIENGIRAALVLVRRYIKLYRLDTPTAIISRWAPPSENNTSSYITQVCTKANLQPHQRIKLNEKNTLLRLLWAMAEHENGQLIHFQYFENAWARL